MEYLFHLGMFGTFRTVSLLAQHDGVVATACHLYKRRLTRICKWQTVSTRAIKSRRGPSILTGKSGIRLLPTTIVEAGHPAEIRAIISQDEKTRVSNGRRSVRMRNNEMTEIPGCRGATETITGLDLGPAHHAVSAPLPVMTNDRSAEMIRVTKMRRAIRQRRERRKREKLFLLPHSSR